jgi:hypothetical protein
VGLVEDRWVVGPEHVTDGECCKSDDVGVLLYMIASLPAQVVEVGAIGGGWRERFLVVPPRNDKWEGE